MASALDDAASLLKRRIRELDDERKKLERALANLTGGRLGRRGPGRPPGSRTRSQRAAAPRPSPANGDAAAPVPTRPSG